MNMCDVMRDVSCWTQDVFYFTVNTLSVCSLEEQLSTFTRQMGLLKLNFLHSEAEIFNCKKKKKNIKLTGGGLKVWVWSLG